MQIETNTKNNLEIIRNQNNIEQMLEAIIIALMPNEEFEFDKTIYEYLRIIVISEYCKYITNKEFENIKNSIIKEIREEIKRLESEIFPAYDTITQKCNEIKIEKINKEKKNLEKISNLTPTIFEEILLYLLSLSQEQVNNAQKSLNLIKKETFEDIKYQGREIIKDDVVDKDVLQKIYNYITTHKLYQLKQSIEEIIKQNKNIIIMKTISYKAKKLIATQIHMIIRKKYDKLRKELFEELSAAHIMEIPDTVKMYKTQNIIIPKDELRRTLEVIEKKIDSKFITKQKKEKLVSIFNIIKTLTTTSSVINIFSNIINGYIPSKEVWTQYQKTSISQKIQENQDISILDLIKIMGKDEKKIDINLRVLAKKLCEQQKENYREQEEKIRHLQQTNGIKISIIKELHDLVISIKEKEDIESKLKLLNGDFYKNVSLCLALASLQESLEQGQDLTPTIEQKLIQIMGTTNSQLLSKATRQIECNFTNHTISSKINPQTSLPKNNPQTPLPKIHRQKAKTIIADRTKYKIGKRSC